MRWNMEGRGVSSDLSNELWRSNFWLYFWELSRNWETRATFHTIRVTVRVSQSHVVVVRDQKWITDMSHKGRNLVWTSCPNPIPAHTKPSSLGKMWLSMTHTRGLLLFPAVPTSLKLNIYTLPRLIPTVCRYCSLHPVHPQLPPRPSQGHYYIFSDHTWPKHIIHSFNSHLQNYPLF